MSRTFKVQYNDKNDNPVVTLSCTSSMNKFKLLSESDKAGTFAAITRWEKCLQELKTELKLLALATVLFTSCSVTGKPGVIKETKKARYVFGNAKHRQQQHDAKIRRDSIKLIPTLLKKQN